MPFVRAITSVRASRWQAPAILVVVWLAFGAAFIVGKIGVSAVPPFLFAAPRFLIAGTILLAWAALRSPEGLHPTRRELAEAVVIGLATITLGQGAAMWAISRMQPGLVAVFTATMPLWIAVLGFVFLRTRIPRLALLGLLVSFAGVCFLASPSGTAVQVLPLVAIVVGTVAWAAGALVASKSHVGRRPMVLAGLQMLIGGAVQLVIAVALGEQSQVHWAGALSVPVVSAFVFSVVVTSVIGFTAYAWLLQNLPPTIANSNAYASPIVALVLGWLVLGDPLGTRTLITAGVILAGVALLIWAQGRRPRPVAMAEPDRFPEAA
jgi:drug/metabolite transporter (DMT)-like permease